MVEMRSGNSVGMSGFKDNHVGVRGLEFAKARLHDYYQYHIETACREQQNLETERDREIRKVDDKVNLLRTRRDEVPENLKENALELASIVRSACEIYLKDLEVLRRRTLMIEFEEEISRVTEFLQSGIVGQAKGGLFDKYYSGEYCDYCGALIPVKGKSCKKCVRVLERRKSLI